MNYEIEVKGISKLIEKLGLATAQETIETPLFQGALNLAAWSRKHRLTGPRPKYLGVISGRLRSSIAVSRSIKRGEFEFRIGTNVRYARIHEFGGFTGKGGRVRIPARPFLRPSIENEENRQKIVNKVAKAINEALAQ